MINIDSIKYERLDLKEVTEEVTGLIRELRSCSDKDEYITLVRKINDIQNHVEEMADIAEIRNMRNVKDEYYATEIKFWEENKVKYDSLFKDYYNELVNSKFREELEKVMPNNFFSIIEYQNRITSPDIAELVKLEGELKNKCRALNLVKLNFNGEELTPAGMAKYYVNKDRNIRKQAHDLVNDYYYEHNKEYDEILFELIKVRKEIAKRLGFNSYIEYSLYNRKRFGYDYSDITKFRDSVLKYIIPINKELSKMQSKELGIDDLKYYDTVFFTEMPEVKANGSELLNMFKDTFASVDRDLSQCYNSMLDSNSIDLESRDDKVTYSITNYITESAQPVVTGNYKNSYADVKTTTHEMGHAFQKYLASIKDREYIVSPLLKYPTMEVAEIFSQAMELIMMDYVGNLFSESDYKKYCFMEVYNFVTAIPYECLVDEFQVELYSKEDLKVEDIRKIWLDLVKKYSFTRSNSGHINLDTGGAFYKTTHIYYDPFYYIDYALSKFCAFSVWNACKDNLDVFKEVGAVASHYSFKDLIEKYNMPNSFDEKVVEEVSNKLVRKLDI